MHRITSLEQYKRIVDQAKENGCRLSNCFFLPEAIRQKIAKGTLLYENLEPGLLLLDNQTSFYRCYYFLSEHDKFRRLVLDKPAVIELPYTCELNHKQVLQVEKIESMGFRLGRKSGMMCSLPERITFDNKISNDICSLADYQDVERIYDLLNFCFNPLYAFLPTLGELEASIRGSKVLVIRNGERIAASLISSIEKGIASIKQVAVNPSYRGQGYGKAILQAYHSRYINEALSFQHWVDMNNFVATSLYVKFGYEFNLRKANEYILTTEES